MSKDWTSVAGVTSTLSKHPALFPENCPDCLIYAYDATVMDDKGRLYTDWISGLLAVTLGYRHPEVNRFVISNLDDEGGPTWSLQNQYEEVVTHQIVTVAS